MARDYTKPGNTPPGTITPKRPRAEKKTWLDVVAPASDFKLKEEPKLPEVVPFTRPVPAHDHTVSRRERRALQRAEGEDTSVAFVTKDEPLHKVVGGARKMARIAAANRARRQRKGQRAFDRQQIAQARERDTVMALVAVADGQTSATPAAVENATFGLQRRMERMQAAQ